jgi:energy-converting hydrogenase Eha subunit H
LFSFGHNHWKLANGFNYLEGSKGGEKMTFSEWIVKQFTEFNVLTFILIIFFSTALSKANATKQLKDQTNEFKEKMEEVKDEIWRAKGSED